MDMSLLRFALYPKSGDRVLTETWLYQYHPFVTDARPVGYLSPRVPPDLITRMFPPIPSS